LSIERSYVSSGIVEAVDSLVAWLHHPSSELREQVVSAIDDIGSERAVEPLIALLQDTDANVRQTAAHALGNLKSERAVEPLIALLQHTNANVRSAAAYALGKIGSERAVEPLIALLRHANANKRHVALEALSKPLEQENRRLLSRDLDGLKPFLDPRETISVERVAKAARVLNLSPEDVRARYEALGSRLKLGSSRLAVEANQDLQHQEDVEEFSPFFG
jgi:HEAT repeat protein